MYESVNFISRKTAELINDPYKQAERIIISVSTPHRSVKTHEAWEKLKAAGVTPTQSAKLVMNSWSDVLKLEFHDAEPSATKNFRIYYGIEQARETITFLERYANTNIKEIFVHCDAGISRSAAIAKFAAQKYGLYFNLNYNIYNKYVFSTLLKTTGQIPSSPTDSAFNYNERLS